MSEAICQCTYAWCPVTIADSGRHPAGPKCEQPAVLHLFYMPGDCGPTDFCEPCGDDALKSGLFITGEDVVRAALRERDWKQ